MSRKIIKRLKIEEELEEQVIEHEVCVEDIATNMINMASSSKALAKATEDNMVAMIQQVKEHNIEISKLK